MRSLRLRRSSLAPSFRDDIPDRLFAEIPLPHSDWPLNAQSDCSTFSLPLTEGYHTASPLSDLIEFLAIRTAPIPFGAFIDVVRTAIDRTAINPWDVVQSLSDAGVLQILQVRGWRGRAVMSCPPRGALIRNGRHFSLVFEGCTNETWVKRLKASVASQGGEIEQRLGVSSWSPPTFAVHHADIASLREIASSINAAYDYLTSGLGPVGSIWACSPIQTPISGAARPIDIDGRHANIALIQPTSTNIAPLWEVSSSKGTLRWKHRNDAILDAYLRKAERPFSRLDDRIVSRDARLPSHVSRWLRLATGLAAGPTDGGYSYAYSTLIERELARIAPEFFGESSSGNVVLAPHSRRWPLRASVYQFGTIIQPIWCAARKNLRGGSIG